MMRIIDYLLNLLILLVDCFIRKPQNGYRYRQCGIKEGRKHSANNRPKPNWVKNEVIRLKAIMGNGVGCRKIANCFNRLYGERETVGKTYVANIIRDNHYLIMQERHKLKNKLPRWVAVNCTWAMDLSFYTTTDKISRPFLGIIDHGSRKALTLQTVINKSSWTLLGYLCLAIGKYGKPNKLRTDNEIIFTSFVFKTFLKLVNIQHQKIPTASPWCNGRIERLFGTLKPMVKLFEISNKKELQSWLNQFRNWYNHRRPHQNLNGKTPEEIWRQRRRK